MGAGTKHSSGQHTFEHGFLPNPEQPGNNSPDIFSQHFAKHRGSQHQPARADESEHQRARNFYERARHFEFNRHRRGGYRNRNLSELQSARSSDARNDRDWRGQQLSKRNQYRRDVG